MITLLDGSAIAPDDVSISSDNIHFTQISTGQDITFLLPMSVKRTFPAFDIYKSNSQLYATDSSGNIIPAASTASTFDIFTNQLLTNPLQAPLADLNAGVKSLFNSSGLQTIALFAGLAFVAWLLLKAEK